MRPRQGGPLQRLDRHHAGHRLKARDEASDTQRKVVELAKRAFRKLRAAPHPDGETNRERARAKTEVAQAINAIMDEAVREFDKIARPRRP